MLKNRSSSSGSPRRARVQTRLPPFARPGFGRAGDRATARWDCGSDFLFLETYLRGSRDAGRGVIWVIEQSFAPGGGVNVSLVTYYDCACVRLLSAVTMETQQKIQHLQLFHRRNGSFFCVWIQIQQIQQIQ